MPRGTYHGIAVTRTSWRNRTRAPRGRRCTAGSSGGPLHRYARWAVRHAPCTPCSADSTPSPSSNCAGTPPPARSTVEALTLEPETLTPLTWEASTLKCWLLMPCRKHAQFTSGHPLTRMNIPNPLQSFGIPRFSVDAYTPQLTWQTYGALRRLNLKVDTGFGGGCSASGALRAAAPAASSCSTAGDRSGAGSIPGAGESCAAAGTVAWRMATMSPTAAMSSGASSLREAGGCSWRCERGVIPSLSA